MTVVEDWADSAPLDYEAAKALARHTDAAVRRLLAARRDAMPEILFFLAADRDRTVRAAAAGNPATPKRTDLLLATDPEEAVRSELVGKIVDHLPANGTPPKPIETIVVDVLKRLSADPSPSIRRLLSEAVRELEQAPRSVVLDLARDRADEVAEPVLRHSPQLGADDLIDLVEEGRSSRQLRAIAARDNLPGSVAAAIVARDDVDATAALLGNASAQIREDTLDRILDLAPDRPAWHRPLVYRPTLPGSAVKRLSEFVARSLLENLAARADLPAEVRADVQATTAHRFGPATDPVDVTVLPVAADTDAEDPEDAEEAAAAGSGRGQLVDILDTDAGADPAAEGPPKAPFRGADAATAAARAGTLTEDDIDDAIFGGDRAYAVAGLAAKIGADASVVESILRSQSPRSVTALVWRAGMSMRLAMKVQLQLARIPSRSVLNARDGTAFPMSDTQMREQLSMFGM